MERIRFIVEQLEECRKLIQKRSKSHYRMAFTLLDNTVEILMYRATRHHLEMDEMIEVMHRRAKAVMPPKEYAKWAANSQLKVVGRKTRRAIDRHYPEKVRYLAGVKKVPEPLAATIGHLHDYRNEMYHRDRVQEDVLRSLTVFLFELACEIFVILHPDGYTSLSPGEEESHGWRRFNRVLQIPAL